MTDATRATSAWRRRPAHDHDRILGAARASAEEPSWQQRYELLLQANERLQEQLRAQAQAHRKSLTVVRYEPSLPNNDVFTKELVEENRQLIARYRALELKLARVENGQVASAASSPRRSVDRSRPPTRKKDATRTGFPLKHASVQTDDVATENGESDEEKAAKQSEEREAKATEAEGDEEDTSQAKTASVDVQFLVTELKHRLADLDVDLVRLREENELLRTEMLQARENGSLSPTTRHIEDLHTQLRTKEQQQELEHLLNDRIRQMKILEEQFTHLQHKVKSKSLLYKESVAKIEELNAELFDAKQTLLKQAEWLHAQEDRNLQLTMLEKEVHVLRSENAKLNDTVGMLSSRPLDALNVQLEKKALQISLLDDEKMRLENELKKASQDYRIVMQTNDKLRGRVETLTKQLDAQLVEVYELKRASEQSSADREIAELQLQFYLSGDSPESKQLMEAVGRALKTMQRGESSIQDDPKGGDGLPEACIVCQHKREEPTSSLYQERIEKINDICRLIQEDTRAQLQDMRVAHQAEVHTLRRQIKRWEQRANEYLKEIAELRREQTPTPSNAHVFTNKPPQGSVKKAKPDQGARPDDTAVETLMSARMFELRFTPQGEPKAAEYVVFCDYFDFEPQHSPVFGRADENGAAGLDMEVSYKLLVDRAFCMSPLAAAFNVELHELHMGSATVVGIASASLQSMFTAADGTSTQHVKILDPTTRVTIGSVRIALSLSRPTSHLMQLWRANAFPRPQAHLSSALSLAGLQEKHHAALSIRVIGLVLAKDTANTTVAEIKLRYRFMGHPTARCSATKPARQAFHGLHYFAVDYVKDYAIPSDQHFLDFLYQHEMALQVKSNASGVDGSAVVAFKRHGAQDWRDVVSVAITRGDPGSERSIGRVWLEVRVDGLANPTTLLDGKSFLPVVKRLFCRPMGPSGLRQITWQRFCSAISLSSAERAVRHMLREKIGSSYSQLPRLRLADANDTLQAMLERCGIRMSRAELSFVSGVLFPDAIDVDQDRTAWQRANRRLELVEATMDSEWLAMETALQHHMSAMDVAVVDHGGQADECIDLDTFAHRMRLVGFNTR